MRFSFETDNDKLIEIIEAYQAMGLISKLEKLVDDDNRSEVEIDYNNIQLVAKEVIEYLNKKTNRRYFVTMQVEGLIMRRLNEGFKLQDFKDVIDSKVRDWTSPKMQVYIRPETLFGPKMNNYLNEHKIKQREHAVSYDGLSENASNEEQIKYFGF